MNGGFVFYDHDEKQKKMRVLQANALEALADHAMERVSPCHVMPRGPSPSKVSPEDAGKLSVLRNALEYSGRFHPVTIPALRKMGITGFCWIIPNEPFPIEGEMPWKSGGFLYRYRDHETAHGHALHDCYYVIHRGEATPPGGSRQEGMVRLLGPFRTIKSYDELAGQEPASAEQDRRVVSPGLVHYFKQRAVGERNEYSREPS